MLAVLSPRLFGYVLLYVGHCAVATVAVCGFGSWGMPHQISPLPHGPTPSQTEVSSTMGESIRPSSFHNPTLSANKHFVHICRSSLLAAADGLTDGSGDRRTSPFNGIERLLSRAVVPKTKSLRVSATTFPTACLCTSQGRLQKDIRYPSRTVAIRKGNTVKLGYYVPSMEKKKTVRCNQSTFYPKRDFPQRQDRFHVFTRMICHGRCFFVLNVVHYSLFVQWNRLSGDREIENVPGKLILKLKGWMTCSWSEKKEPKKGQKKCSWRENWYVVSDFVPRPVGFIRKKCTCFPIGDVCDRRRERYNRVYVLSRVRTNRVSL